MAGTAKFKKVEHDPQDELDYTEGWSKWLQSGEQIAFCTWEVFRLNDDGDQVPDDTATPLEAYDQSVSPDGTEVTVWVRGGTLGNKYVVTAHITTNSTPNPRKTDKSWLFTIVHK